ncbi:unnamed protein product, partial [Closterium sp. NIES-53]
MDMLPASLWHWVFRCLLLPPGSSYPENPLVHSRRKTPWYLTATTQPPAGRILPVKFVDPDFTAVGQHRKNSKSYGSGWALLCCAMASKRLLTLVLSFSVSAALSMLDLMFGRPRLSLALTYTHIILLSHFHSPSSIRTHPSLPAQHPICLVYNDLHPQRERSVASCASHFRSGLLTTFRCRTPSPIPLRSAGPAPHLLGIQQPAPALGEERHLLSIALQIRIEEPFGVPFPHPSPLRRPSTPSPWSTTTYTRNGRGVLPSSCAGAASGPSPSPTRTSCSCTRSARRPSGEVTEEKGQLRWACGPSGEVTEEKGHLRWACGSLALTYTHIMQLHTLCSQAEWPSGEVTEEKGHLRWACGSLALTYTHIMQLNMLCSQDQWQFSSLTSLSLKLRGCVDSAQQFDTVEQGDRDEVEEEYWTQYFDCPRLQRLKLGRGKGVLQNGWADEFKALHSLTLKHRWNFDEASSGPRSDGNSRFCFDCSSARVLHFFFAQISLTLFLTLSRSLKAFSAVAKRLVLSCKSTLPLYLHHLSLYGQERLIISSLTIASARERFEVDWEVEKCEDDGEKEVTVEEFQERNQTQRVLQQRRRQQQQQQPWRQQAEQEEEEEEGGEEEQQQGGKPPIIRAPKNVGEKMH